MNTDNREKTAMQDAIDYIDGTIGLGEKARIEAEMLGLTQTVEIIKYVIKSHQLARTHLIEVLLPKERKQIEDGYNTATKTKYNKAMEQLGFANYIQPKGVETGSDYYTQKFGG